MVPVRQGNVECLDFATHLTAGIGLRTPLLILREVTGAGYIGTALLLGLAIAARTLLENKGWFWVCYAVVPVALCLVSDALAHYFVAVRQIIFVLTPLAIMASAGIIQIWLKKRSLGLALGALLIGTLLFGDIHFVSKPRENWQLASINLRALAAKGGCILFAPADSVNLYSFFAPDLQRHTCDPNVANLSPLVAVAVSPYDQQSAAAIHLALSRLSYVKISVRDGRKPEIEIFRR